VKSFTYSYPVKVAFADNSIEEKLPELLKNAGQKVMLAYGKGAIKKAGIYDRVVKVLKDADKEIVEFSGIMSNPTYEKVLAGAKLAKDEKVDFILAVGGGSVIDCCKIVSAQAKLENDIWNYEYQDKKRPDSFIPLGCIVTAFGTGAEMNNGAVITNEKQNLKAPLWGAFYDFALLDPALTLTMPLSQVISGAFDSLSHCMEIYMGTPRDSCVSDEINEAVQRNIIKNLRKTLKNPQDLEARSELVWDAAMAENGILKIGKVTDFQCHMLEHQLGAYTDCNHGQGLAVIHPVLYSHMAEEAKEQFSRLAVSVWNVDKEGKSEKELALAFVDALQNFIKECSLPTSFTQMGISKDTDFKAIAESTFKMKGCAKQFTSDELLEILKECL